MTDKSIVNFRNCYNNKDYGKTIINTAYPISKSIVGVRKCKKDGADGLSDLGGKHKDEASMSEAEKLCAQLKLQKAENLRLQMENDLLKKLEALERGETRIKFSAP